MIMMMQSRMTRINLTAGAGVWGLPHYEDIHHTLYSNRHMVPPPDPPILIPRPTCCTVDRWWPL